VSLTQWLRPHREQSNKTVTKPLSEISVMRTKIIAALLAVLTALGGLNLFQSIKKKIQPGESGDIVAVEVERRTSKTKYEYRAQAESKTEVKTKAKLTAVQAGAETMIEESFSVSDGDNLIVNIDHADVYVETGSGSRATVTVTLESRRMEKAKERFEAQNWEVYQDGDSIHIQAESPNGRWNVDMNTEVLVTIPSSFNVDLETSHGDLEMGDLAGNLRLLTSHGDVELAEVSGPRIWVKSSHGDIEANSLRSDEVDVQTSHADIEVHSVYSRVFNATTSHADVEIEYLEGRAAISTSHGDIEVEISGSEGATFETQHGDVVILIDGDSTADLDLKAENVKVASSLNVRGQVRDDRVDGSINGGGQMIKARTTHGSVSIRER